MNHIRARLAVKAARLDLSVMALARSGPLSIICVKPYFITNRHTVMSLTVITFGLPLPYGGSSGSVGHGACAQDRFGITCGCVIALESLVGV